MLRDKPVFKAAQGLHGDYENLVVFGSDDSRIWLLDLSDGSNRLLGDFSADERGLGSGELKGVSSLSDGTAQIFWWSRDGEFVLKRIPMSGIAEPWEVQGIGELYLSTQIGDKHD
jgi:hypothetical protein